MRRSRVRSPPRALLDFSCCWSGSGVTDANGNGIKDLAEVIDQTGTTDDLTPPQANSGNTTKLVIEVGIANDSGSYTGSDEAMMADGAAIKIDVILNQDSSQ